jgi:hypothetical protein
MCFKAFLTSLGSCKSLIYIGPKRVYSVKFARVLTIAQNSAKIAVNGVAKIQQNECGLVDSFGS